MPTPPAVPAPMAGQPAPIPEFVAARMPRARDLVRGAQIAPAPPSIGRWNVVLGWWSIVLSLCAGAVLGLWAFGGPLTPPALLGAYDDPGRRLLRLAHIAAVMLPVLSFHFVRQLPRGGFAPAAARRWCGLLLFGALGLPLALAVAAFWRAGLYLLPLPVTAVLASVLALAVRLTVVEWRGTAPTVGTAVET